jgi:outer membrane protein assembly factor BamA
VGETVGAVPIQKHFDLGGISTLRAFKYKEFTGDRMILANLEYQIDWDRLDWALDLPIVNELNLILFADAGLAWFKADKDFDELASRDFHSDIGIAFATSNGSFRLNVAKRTDRSKDAVRVTFRISRPF